MTVSVTVALYNTWGCLIAYACLQYLRYTHFAVHVSASTTSVSSASFGLSFFRVSATSRPSGSPRAWRAS
jgi:hypothetical protein